MSAVSSIFGISAYFYACWILIAFYFWIIDVPVPNGLSSFLVLKKIDHNDGNLDDVWVAALKNFGIFLGFAISHVVLARPWYKQFAEKYFYSFKFERSMFLVVAAGFLHTLMQFWSPMPVIYTIRDAKLELVFGKIIPTIGLMILLLSSFQIDHFELFGLKQSMEIEIPELTFQTNGFYRFVRHPIMTGFLLMVNFNSTISYGRLFLAFLMDFFIVYVVYKFEEPLLVKMLGKKYSNYQKNVPAFFPMFGSRKNITKKNK